MNSKNVKKQKKKLQLLVSLKYFHKEIIKLFRSSSEEGKTTDNNTSIQPNKE